MEKQLINKRISIIGSGNVATHFASKWYEAGFDIAQIYSRTIKHAKKLARLVEAIPIRDLAELDLDVDLIVISVRDDFIPKMIDGIPNTFKGLVVHTSGVAGLKELKKQFKQYGILYPLQSFTKGYPVLNSQFPLLIEGNSKKVRSTITKYGQVISQNTQHISTDQKQKLHLAAVFANNFGNHIFEIAEKICNREDIDFKLLLPLISETVEKLSQVPIENRQTGPAVRKDKKTIDRHLEMLQIHPELSAIYDLLSKNIQKMHDS